MKHVMRLGGTAFFKTAQTFYVLKICLHSAGSLSILPFYFMMTPYYPNYIHLVRRINDS